MSRISPTLCEELFYSLARDAIYTGLLTIQERDIISRRGTSKERNWCRHLHDLREILKERVTEPSKNPKVTTPGGSDGSL